MKKRTFSLLILLPFLVAFTACMSLPKKENSDDCLIIMKTITVNNTTSPMDVRSFFLRLSAGYGSVKIGKDYTAFIIGKPNVEILSLTTSISEAGEGDRGQFDVLVMLPYNPGHAIVLDTAFVQTMSAHGGGSFMHSANFRKLEDSELKEFISELRKDPAFSDWEF